MCLTWIVGVYGANSGCLNLSYLRGSPRLPTTLQADESDPDAHPWVHSAVVGERARLAALAKLHRQAFPLAVAKVLLSTLLVLASVAALTGRRNARTLALQVIAACALLAAVDWIMMDPVRVAMAQAVARDAVEHGMGPLPDTDHARSVETYQSIHLWIERLRLALLELGVFGGAAYALTREQTKRFFAAVAAHSDTDRPDSDDPPPP